jgi:raffinose/stachyose/melibiose transport system substrate-binding protein
MKRTIQFALALLTIATLLIGCAAPAAPAAPAGEAAPATEETTASADTAAADSAASGDKVKIVWWGEGSTVDATSQQAIQEQLIDAFNAEHPNIELEIVWQESNNETLRAALQAGQGPDIAQTPGPGYLLEYQKAGFLLPLNDFAAEFGWEDKILPWAYASGVVDGELYGLPLTFESMLVLYNTKVFEELGLQPPTNRAEFEAVADAIAASGRVPIAYGNVGWQPTNEHLIGMWLNATAGSQAVYEALIGERSWEDPVFVDSINLLTDYIAKRGYFGGSLEDYYSLDWDTFFSMLQTGDAGMMTIGTWGFRGAADSFVDNPDEWDWFMMPSMTEGVPQGFDLAIGSTISINAKSAHPAEAAEVLNWIYADPQRAASIASIFSFGEMVLPIQYGPNDFPADTDPRISRFFTQFGEVTGAGDYGYTSWTFWPAEAETQLWTDIELVWAGEMTTEEYLAKQQALWEKARSDGGVPPIPER